MNNRQSHTVTDAEIQGKTEIAKATLPQEIVTLNSEFIVLQEQLQKAEAETRYLNNHVMSFSVSEQIQAVAGDIQAVTRLKQDLNEKVITFLANETERMQMQMMREDLKSIRKNNPDLYDQIISFRANGHTYEQAIIKVLQHYREAGVRDMFRISQLQNYYKGVLIQLLQLALKEENSDLFVTLHNADVEEFKRLVDSLSTQKKLDEDVVKQAKKLREVLEGEKLDYSKLEKNILEFRNSLKLNVVQAALNQKVSLLFCLMPDLTASDRFPFISNRQVKEACTANYAQHSVMLEAAKTIGENADVAEISQSVQGYFTAELALADIPVIAKTIPIGKYGLNQNQWTFILTFIAKHTQPRFWQDASRPELTKIIQENHDSLSLLLAIKKFATNRFSPSPLQLYFLHHFNNLAVDRDIINIAGDPQKLTRHKEHLQKLAATRKRLAELDVAKNQLRTRLEHRLDKPMLAVLRMNVLHAAMLYLGRYFQAGMFLCLPDIKRINHLQGARWVLTLVQKLCDPALKDFREASRMLEVFFARHAREYSGLASDSFDIFLMQTLFNEGMPKGLFRMSGQELKTLNVARLNLPNVEPLLPDPAFKKLVMRLSLSTKMRDELLFAADKNKLKAKINQLPIPIEEKTELQAKLAQQIVSDKACEAYLKLLFLNPDMQIILLGEVADWLKEGILAPSQRRNLRFTCRDNLLLLGNNLHVLAEAKEPAVRQGFLPFSITN